MIRDELGPRGPIRWFVFTGIAATLLVTPILPPLLFLAWVATTIGQQKWERRQHSQLALHHLHSNPATEPSQLASAIDCSERHARFVLADLVQQGKAIADGGVFRIA